MRASFIISALLFSLAAHAQLVYPDSLQILLDKTATDSALHYQKKVIVSNEIADDIKQNLENINHHGSRADAIVKGMLLHSRTSTGQKELPV